MNIGDPWPGLEEAEHRVLVMQTKLHQWAKADPGRRFDDLANLVYDPAFLVVAWARVRGNKGARTAGVDGVAPRSIVFGAAALLGQLRDDLKAGRFVPQRVRAKTIPKANGKLRSLGIPTAADRVVQASLKLVLEPIFEADFKPCSYGFRPRRRAQDAIAEIHYFGSSPRNYEWVFEADIKACFDEIDHTALMGRVRGRVGDKRVLGLGEGVPQHFGRPGTPTDQAWIESLFGHLKAEWPHLLAVRDPVVLRAELAIARSHYNGVRLHAGIGYVTPDDEHDGRGASIRKAREAGLEAARLRRLTYHRQQRLNQPDHGPLDVG